MDCKLFSWCISARYLTIAWTILIGSTFLFMPGLINLVRYRPLYQNTQNIGFILELHPGTALLRRSPGCISRLNKFPEIAGFTDFFFPCKKSDVKLFSDMSAVAI